MACAEALRIIGANLERAVRDPHDAAARERMMFAATLAGIGFGNAGVHIPHAMAYAVAGRVRSFRPPGYPAGEPIVPHGMSVILNAPAVFARTGAAAPERHREAAGFLGADLRDIGAAEAGPALADHLTALMRATGMPDGLRGVGYGPDDLDALVAGTLPQARLLANAPVAVDAHTLRALFADALEPAAVLR
jgi:alcohol dehydrogenase class IV